jgi:hypothetical protein
MKNPIRLILSAFLLLTTARAGLAADLSEIFKDLGQATPSQLQIAASTQALGGATGPLYPSAQVEQNVIFEGDLLPVTNKSLAIFSDDGVDVYVDGLLIHSRHGKGQHLPNLAQSLHVLPIILKKNTSYHIKVVYSNILYKGDWDVDGCTLFAYNAPWVDLDVDNDGYLDYPDDGVEHYLPGFAAQGTEQILTRSNQQLMKLIAQDVVDGTEVKFELVIPKTSTYPGICSNADSDGTYPSGPSDLDLLMGDPANNDADTANAVTVPASQNEARVPVKARDFGVRGKFVITQSDAGNGQVLWQGGIAIPKDTDDDLLPDDWEDKYSNPVQLPQGFKKFNKADPANPDTDRDDDRNKSGIAGGIVGDNFTAFDEYRGFLVRQYAAQLVNAGIQGQYVVYNDTGATVFKRTSPVVKDLFLESNDVDGFTENFLGYGLSHENDLAVHHLTSDLRGADGTNDEGVVNFKGNKNQKQKRVLIKPVVQGLDVIIWKDLGITPFVGGFNIPNTIGILNEVKGANIFTPAIMNAVMYVDGDGTKTEFPGYKNGQFDNNKNYFKAVPQGQGKTFKDADRVYWADKNTNGIFDKGDFLWLDKDGTNEATDTFDVGQDGDDCIIGSAKTGLQIHYYGSKINYRVTLQNDVCWLTAFDTNKCIQIWAINVAQNQNRRISVSDTKIELTGGTNPITINIGATTTLQDVVTALTAADTNNEWNWVFPGGILGEKAKDLVDFAPLDPTAAELGKIAIPLLPDAEVISIPINANTKVEDLIDSISIAVTPFRAERIGLKTWAENATVQSLTPKEVQFEVPRHYTVVVANPNLTGNRLNDQSPLVYLDLNGDGKYTTAPADMIFRNDNDLSLYRFKLAQTLAHEAAGHPCNYGHVFSRTIMFSSESAGEGYLSAVGIITTQTGQTFIFTIPTEFAAFNKRQLRLKP